MKKILLVGAIIGFVVLNACNDKEAEVNPLARKWKLDEYDLAVKESGFESNDASGDASGSYILELKNDFTYTRTVGESPNEEVENGNWSEDGDFIELDPEAGSPKQDDLFYEFDIVSVDERQLDITFEENFYTFPDAKISEWFSNGTVDDSGAWTITDSQIDSIITNYLVEVTMVYNLNFDIVN
ncbi:MAG: hypothetical protein ACFHWX_20015 [Bacteroidota bacterium]